MLLLMLKVTVVVTVKFCPGTATDDRDVGLAHRGGGGGGVFPPPPPDTTRGPAREPSPLVRLVEGGDSNCAGLLQADRIPEIKVYPDFSSQISVFAFEILLVQSIMKLQLNEDTLVISLRALRESIHPTNHLPVCLIHHPCFITLQIR